MLLYQPLEGYCYNSDTHFLHDFIIKNLVKFKNVKGNILDIGSGSGILGLLVCQSFPKLNLFQSEIQNPFIFLSLKNSKVNKINSYLYQGSFLEEDFKESFEFCISNPPFYHKNVIKSENKNKNIARYNDNLPLEEFIKKTSQILSFKAKLFFCYDAKQLNEIVILLNKYKLNLEVLQFIHPKKHKEASLVMIYARKNSNSLLKVLSPLIVFENEEFSSEVKKIYERCATHSIKVDIEQFN